MEEQPTQPETPQPAEEPSEPEVAPTQPETPEPEPDAPVEPQAPPAEDDEPGEDDEPEPAEPEAYKLKSFEDLSALADSGELTQNSLQAELKRYRDAYLEEFEISTQQDSSNVVEYTTEFFKKNVAEAAAQIVWLATSAESESVRGNMSKYIIEQATKQAVTDGDPIKDLLESLTKNDRVSENAGT